MGKVTPDTIAEVRANREVAERLEDEMEIASNKAKASEARNKPGQILQKAAQRK